MGRLSTIEDVEKRQEAQAQAAQQTILEADSPAASENAEVLRDVKEKKSAAQEEYEFHGLGDQEKRSAGHTFLIVAAVVIVIVVAVKFADYTLHFL